jgi:hypothetical protein
MPENPEQFKHLFAEDPFGLLAPRPAKNTKAEHASLLASFEEITAFFEREGRVPSDTAADILEYQLFKRLDAIRSSPDKVKILKPYDLKSLLRGQPEATLADVIKDDVHGLLKPHDDDSITKLRFVKKSERINPVYLSRRRNCKDFDKYRQAFDLVHADLASRRRRLVSFSATSVQPGCFYVLGGLLFYLESVQADSTTVDFKSGSRDRYDGRTRCIFENSTESDMLLRSLVKAMQVEGYSISDIEEVSDLPTGLSPDDQLGGYIYVLKTLNEQFKGMEDLYKIGHTTTTVAERIKNAKEQATYLFSEVEVFATFRVANVSSVTVEKALHAFFDYVRLDVEIEIPNESDSTYRPREWFNVRFPVIEEAIGLILAGKDSQYIYDPRVSAIIKRPV